MKNNYFTKSEIEIWNKAIEAVLEITENKNEYSKIKELLINNESSNI